MILREDLTCRCGGDGGQRSSQAANRNDLPVLQIPGRGPKGAACTSRSRSQDCQHPFGEALPHKPDTLMTSHWQLHIAAAEAAHECPLVTEDKSSPAEMSSAVARTL